MENSNLELKLWPDPVLRTKCVEKQIPTNLGDEMLKVMKAHSGLGLAAPQVGLDYRIFVMEDLHEKGPGMVFANPKIVDHSREMDLGEEGCLSLLSCKVKIPRFRWVDIEFGLPYGYPYPVGDDRLEWHFEGILARCIQHEMDHLDGILIFDHITSNLAQKIWLEKYFKRKKKYDRIG